MNSEVPPIPESDNSNLPQNDSLYSSLQELKVESTSDFDDAWLEDDIVDVTVEPEAKSQSSQSDLNSPTVEESDLAANDEVIELADLEPTSEDFDSSEESLENNTEDGEATDKTTVKTLVVESSQSQKQNPEGSTTESDLFVDSWLDEPEINSAQNTPIEDAPVGIEKREIDDLKEQKSALQNEIESLRSQKEQMLLQQTREIQQSMAQIVEEGTKELKERKTALQIEIEKLERRRDRINQEMRSSFAGSSQELAVKVQGFKEYLVGSLQDLARAADKLDLVKREVATSNTQRRTVDRDEEYDMGTARARNRGDRDRRDLSSRGTGRDSRNTRDSRGSRRDNRDLDARGRNSAPIASQGQFSEPTFADQSRRIRQLIDKYSNNPDYYGSPWQLRRTFEPVHAKKVQDWFFVQGGRGAVDSMGSRLQNILVASAAISILHNLYGDRCRVLVLTDTPENLGEWRRGLQDCLGISRSNFGSNRGVTLFDSPEIVVQRAERLIEEKLLPMIIIDETDELLNLSVLKFPIWLAFASSNKQGSSNYLY